MDSFQVYRDIKARTDGEIYLGVVCSGTDRQINIYQKICGSSDPAESDGCT